MFATMALFYRRNKTRAVILMLLLLVALGLVWNKKFHWFLYKISRPEIGSSAKILPGNVATDAPVIAQPIHVLNASSLTRSYTLEGMRDQAMALNFVQNIKNREKFGDHRADDPVIVVQSHDRPDLLKKLLTSLRVVQGIDGATLIISRDKFTPEMDVVVDENIDFCRYLEIFFPFSMQLYPDKFPGDDPNDCSRDLSKSSAREKGCNNAEYPDMYGHYREVKFVQIKHHWFWKLNMVFAGIRGIKDNTGPILLLEDDNYVAPDLIDIMRKAVLVKNMECKDCLAITLGSYDFNTDYKNQGSDIDIKPWLSTKHNIGMVVTNSFYDKLLENQKYFCTYDDYNWDWTLQSTALKCFQEHLIVMVLKVPRVYHLGCTGFHQKDSGVCNIDEETKKLEALFQEHAENFFPHRLKVQSNSHAPNSAHVQNGGWGDLRDHELCQSYHDLCKSMSTVVK